MPSNIEKKFNYNFTPAGKLWSSEFNWIVDNIDKVIELGGDAIPDHSSLQLAKAVDELVKHNVYTHVISTDPDYKYGVYDITKVGPTSDIETYSNGMTIGFMPLVTNTVDVFIKIGENDLVPLINTKGSTLRVGSLIAGTVYNIMFDSDKLKFIMVDSGYDRANMLGDSDIRFDVASPVDTSPDAAVPLRYLEERFEGYNLQDPIDMFMADKTGASIDHLPSYVRDCNNALTEPIPGDGTITKDFAIRSGLTKVDSADNTKTEWFAVAGLNSKMIKGAGLVIQGTRYSRAGGYYEWVTHPNKKAFSEDVSQTQIEFFIVRAYKQDVSEYAPLGNTGNPFSSFHEYVMDKLGMLEDIVSQDIVDGIRVKFVSKLGHWNTTSMDDYLTTYEFPRNEWMDLRFWQPGVLVARFVNVSATTQDVVPSIPFDPNYVPGQMTPQPIDRYGYNAYIKKITGYYYYRNIIRKG